MDAKQLQDQLVRLIEAIVEAREDADDPANDLAEHVEGLRRVSNYADLGMMTRDAGLVIETDDGSEFQLTIVQSR